MYRIESAKGTETFTTITAAAEWLERMQPAYAVLFQPADDAARAEGLDEIETDLAEMAGADGWYSADHVVRRFEKMAEARAEDALRAPRTIEIDGLTIQFTGDEHDERFIRRAVQAADEGGIIQADDAVDLFPGRPEWHEVQRLVVAIRRLGGAILKE